MGMILSILWLIAFIYGVITVLGSGLPPIKKLLWIVLFLLLGPIGVILWFLLGR